MSITEDMVRTGSNIAAQRCRVTQWKVNDKQVWELAEELAPLLGFSVLALVDRMVRGNEMFFGARIKVVFPDDNRGRFA